MALAIEFDQVEFAYPQGPPVLSGVDLRVEPGEFVAIAGPMAAARRRCCGSRSGSSDRPEERCVYSGNRHGASAGEPRSGTSHNARSSVCTRR